MTIVVGSYSLVLAALAAMAILVMCVLGGREPGIGLRQAVRGLMAVIAVAFGAASGALLSALMDSDFHLEYVAHFTEKALPTGYKLAAFWAGQEGSLLLWGLLLAVMSMIAVFVHRKTSPASQMWTAGVLAVVCGFFAGLMLFVPDANPFRASETPVMDGGGLNPLLQDPAMIAHPPLLLLGYAAFTIPFALMAGGVLGGNVIPAAPAPAPVQKKQRGGKGDSRPVKLNYASAEPSRVDESWVTRSRPWMLLAWLFLTAGILLGCWWAYIELGWGGYWAWDPVENASLLPWLTGTAMLHSAIVHRQRGSFKAATVGLASLTFLLCIFGTWLTRSGAVSSVHSFGESDIGKVFLAFLAAMVLFSIVTMAVRWRSFRAEQPITGLLSREVVLAAVNVLLVVMMFVTAFGTVWPIFSSAVQDNAMSANQKFYNHSVLPLALVLIGFMVLGPLVGYGQTDTRKVNRGLVWPAAAAVAAAGFEWGMGIRDAWALACGILVAAVAAGIVADSIRTTASGGGGLVRRVLGNHRRYGAHLAHIGLLVMAAGITGSSVYRTKQEVMLLAGQSTEVSGYTVTFDSMRTLQAPTHIAYEALLRVKDPGGAVQELRPQHQIHTKKNQAITEVAVNTTLARDFYVSLAGYSEDMQQAALEVLINPLVAWIWVGGILLMAGGMVCLLPLGSLRPSAAVERIDAPSASAMGTPSPASN